LRRYGEQELLSIEDVTPFVVEQRQHLRDPFGGLSLPDERVYRPADHEAIAAVGIETTFT